MDDIRGSLSKMKKKVKHRLTGKKPKPDGVGPGPSGEGADSTSSLPQPDPHVVADESCDGKGDRADPAGERVFSTDRPPQPDQSEFEPAHGGDVSQEGGDADIHGGEPSQSHPHPHSGSEIGVGSGSSRETEWFSLSGSTPSLSLHDEEPDGT